MSQHLSLGEATAVSPATTTTRSSTVTVPAPACASVAPATSARRPALRVALIAPPWLPVPPTAYGGTEAVVDTLARGLQDAGHHVVLLAHPDSACPVPRPPMPEVMADAHMGDGVHEARHVLAAYDWIRGSSRDPGRRVDLVHDHTTLGPLLAGRDAGVPVITTQHGPFDDATVPLYRAIARHATIVAISHSQAATARDVPIGAVIPHGIDVTTVPIGAGDGDYVLFLGRMAAAKGVHDAVRLARAAGHRLVIAAKMREASEHRYFADAVQPLLGDDAIYVGEVDREAKLRLLGGARALLNPIRWNEPFGMVMLEALACATPVVTFAAGAAPEIVDHGRTGYLCHTDAEMIAALEALDRLDRAACRAAATDRLSVTAMVRAHVELYRTVTARAMAGGLT